MKLVMVSALLWLACGEMPRGGGEEILREELDLQALQTPIGGQWSATGSLITARSRHAATLLPNGKVLVAGGQDTSTSPLASAEVYDPATGLWSPTGSLATARVEPTATLLPNGKVLVSGGSGQGGYLASAEVYDPATGTWSTAGTMAMARLAHMAMLLPSGKVLVSGGIGPTGSLAGAEIYDPGTGQWSPTGSMRMARYNHTATLLQNGKVLISGGVSPSGVRASAEVYDPSTGQWSPTGSMPTARYDHTATLLPDGNVLAVGGRDMSDSSLPNAEVYDPATGAWSTTSALAVPRHWHTATLLPGGKVLVSGGYGWGSYLASAEVYDPATRAWSVTVPPATACTGHTATLLPSGKVLIAGGEGPVSIADAELYYEEAPGAPTVSVPGFINTQKPVIAGTAEAGSTVTVWLDGINAGTAIANAAGLWVFTSIIALTEGPHQVFVSATDVVGNFSPFSSSHTFTVDTVQPLAPQVSSPGNFVKTSNPVIYGTAEAGSTVTIFLDANEAGMATTDGTGAWSVAPTVNLQDGSHIVHATATDAAGNTSMLSENQGFAVDTWPPGAPTVTVPSPLAASQKPVIGGTAEPEVRVTVLLDGTWAGTIMADLEGNWNFIPTRELSAGLHQVGAIATDTAGNMSPLSAEHSFTIQGSHYGWSCTSASALPATWTLLTLGLLLRRRPLRSR